MSSVKVLYDLTNSKLKDLGIRDYRSEAEYIISKILNLNKVDYYLYPEKEVCKNKISKVEKVLYRRFLREPLPYIFNEIEFYGFNFKLNNKVLIPRQETEIIVERAIFEINKNSYKYCADIGTGCGNIAIPIAKLTNIKKIFAVDIDKKILDLAKKNARLLRVEDKIEFVVSNVLSYFFCKNIKLDLIISNPPYVTEEEYENLQPEIYYEPIHSLLSKGGLDIYKKIAEKINSVLMPKGTLILEINPCLENYIKKIFSEKNFYNIITIKDYNNLSRGLVIKR